MTRIFKKPLNKIKNKNLYFPIIVILMIMVYGLYSIYFCKNGGWIAAGGAQIYVKPEPDSICCKIFVCREYLTNLRGSCEIEKRSHRVSTAKVVQMVAKPAQLNKMGPVDPELRVRLGSEGDRWAFDSNGEPINLGPRFGKL